VEETVEVSSALPKPVLYLVGGPMRTGKSQIAARFNARSGVSYISTDDICYMLGLGAPGLGIGWDAGNTWQQNRRLAAPFLEHLARIRIDEGRALLIEGEVDTEMTGRLLEEHAGAVRACFVGTASLALADKIAAIKAWSDAHDDWLSGKPDEEVAWAARECLAASSEYEAAAKALEVPYFDLSDDWGAGVGAVVRYLVSGASRTPSSH
jgi:hypothetical protein